MKEKVAKFVSGTIPPPPVTQALGIHLARGEDGIGIAEYIADGRHASPMGTLHGGLFCDVADAAMGMAMASVLDEGTTFTTLALTMSYLRPVWNAKLTATARIAHRGRTTALVECDITDDQGRLVARASSTCLILTGEAARGR